MPVLELFGIIGCDISLDWFSYRLSQLRNEYPTETITLKINSVGGSCSEGWAIAHLVENDGNIDTMNIGLAASVAGFILQKGKRRLSASSSMTMMHRAQLSVDGDSTELARLVDTLKEWDAEIVKVIANRTNIKDETEINRLLEAPGWWCNSETALENGLIDEIISTEPKQSLPQNSVEFITKNYAALPYNVLNQIITLPTNQTSETTMTPEELKALCDGIAAAIVTGNQPLVEAITKFVETESAEPSETEATAATNATKAIVTAAIEPALLAMTDASTAIIASNTAIADVVKNLAAMPAPNNQGAGAPFVYGLGGDTNDTTIDKKFV